MLTIAYMTNRKEPMFEWFFSSLYNECNGNFSNIKLVAVDFWKDHRDRNEWHMHVAPTGAEFYHVKPKPSVWQGESRLTKVDWFAASNARNTGLCYASDGYIAYVDDLSVLIPGWLNRVRAAIAGKYIACGAYKKVKNLHVENGKAVSYEEFPQGIDNRLRHASQITDTFGNWLYGCSCAIPVEALLKINGWPEDLCDSLGSEDYITGMVLEKNGYKFKYDPGMMTLESEERHHHGPVFKRSDFGVSPNDKSHKALSIATSTIRFTNDFGGGFSDIALLRQHVLKGGAFPNRNNPRHEWFTGKPLSEL